MSEFEPSGHTPKIGEPRIAIAPNVFVHAFEPGSECLYIFNIYPIRDSDPKLVVILDEEVERLIRSPFVRTEDVRMQNGIFETEQERLEFIERHRLAICMEHEVRAEEIVVTEFNKRDAQRITGHIMDKKLESG